MQESNSKQADITLCLKDSLDPVDLGQLNLIHREEFEHICSIINQRIESVELPTSSLEPLKRHNDTITVLGGRGTGKTTFIKSVLKHFEKNEKVLILPLLDPTLIEEKEHIFITILSLINERINQAIKTKCCTQEKTNLRKEWQDDLKKLSRGLPTLNGRSSLGEGMDPEYIMEKGLDNTLAAVELEKNFHNLIQRGLRILNKKILLIALDDIDVDFKKGWSVLETLRKYLSSQFIIPIVTGDLELFTKSMRKNQWKSFGKALLINEGQRGNKFDEYNNFVTAIESQYLIKVLPPNYRILLTSLEQKRRYLRGGINHIKVIGDSCQKSTSTEGRDRTIVSAYSEVLQRLGFSSYSEIDTYVSHLLSLPIRTQIHFLWEVLRGDLGKREEDFTQAFLSEIYEKLDRPYVRQGDSLSLISTVLDLLVKERQCGVAYQLQPTTLDPVLNNVLLALSLTLSQRSSSDPALFFDYLIRIGFVRNLIVERILLYDDQSQDRGDQSQHRGDQSLYRANEASRIRITGSLSGFLEHASILQSREARPMVGYMAAYLQAIYRHTKLIGFKKIQNLNVIAKQRERESDRIDTIFKHESRTSQILAYIPFSISQQAGKNETFPTYSIWTLLGAITDLLRTVHQSNGGLLDRGVISEALPKLSQVRFFPSPDDGATSASPTGNLALDELITSSDDNIDGFVDTIEKWIGTYKELLIPSYVIGKIATRFFYSLNGVGESNLSNLGDMMHISVIAFLNSALIECSLEELEKATFINRNNVGGSSRVFVNNLSHIIKRQDSVSPEDSRDAGYDDKLKLVKWLCSCPLLLAYINLKESVGQTNESGSDLLGNKILSFLGVEEPLESYCPFNIYEKLSQAKVTSTSLNLPRFNSKGKKEFLDKLREEGFPEDMSRADFDSRIRALYTIGRDSQLDSAWNKWQESIQQS